MFGRCLERLCLVHGLLPFPVGQWPRPNNAAPSLQPHYRAFDATMGCSAPRPASVLSPSRLEPLAACPFTRRRDEAQVLTFRTKAWSSLRAAYMRMPLGQYQGIPGADPGGSFTPVLTSPNSLSTLLQRFASARLSRPCLPKSCSHVSATLTTTAFAR